MAEADVMARRAEAAAAPAAVPAESGEPRRMTNIERIAELREEPGETLVESTDKRCAVLLHMIKELRAAGAFCDDTVLQLTMFLVVNLDNPGFEYDYYLDSLGPNCRDLQGDINTLSWLHAVYWEDHPYGPNFLVLPKGESFLRHFPATLEQCGSSVGRAVGIAVSRPLPELMRLVSAMYLMLSEEGRSMTPEELVEFYRRVRVLAERPVIEKAFEEAGDLLSNSAAGQAASA